MIDLFILALPQNQFDSAIAPFVFGGSMALFVGLMFWRLGWLDGLR